MRRRPFNDQPFPYHHELELAITSLTNLGLGVGRVDGWVVMVPFVIPGERVRARVFRNHSGYSEADLLDVLEPSPQRIDPVCPLFGTCGGCQYQHIHYEEQLRWKRRQVSELLQRMAGIETEVEPVVPSPRQYGYRSKLTPHFHQPKSGGTPAIGFLAQGSRRRMIDVPACPIAMDGINAALPEVREEVFRHADRYKKGATLLLREGAEGVVTDPRAVMTEDVGALRFRFLAGEFFQNNPFILEFLLAHVAESCGDVPYLIDAYCGSGLFAVSLAGRFRRALGVEISEKAVSWAEENARRNGVENCTFQVGEAASIFSGVDFPGAETAVIIDPPRKGADEPFLNQLFSYGPKRVVYVSCNPATQIRDLKLFQENGYTLLRVQPFDLFPQTRHLECVVTLTRYHSGGGQEAPGLHQGH